ncbi:M60 family metallopeptidase [Pantoea phytobeneficialis]|nr:M60 family metallopeptidase [Pantoea phytobeneficialis]MDO6407418.1 M60 family metallopeptidase [Pantoea phytobeneficialis]
MTLAQSWPRAIKFLKKTVAQKDYNQDAELGYEGRLMMFHQLWLAYGDNFYQTLHRHYRVSAPDLPTDAEKINSFIINASIYSGYNLASFFTTWGLMPKDPNAYNTLMAELNALKLPDTRIDPYTLTDLAD